MRSIEDDTDHYHHSDGGSTSLRWPKPEVFVQMNPSSKPRISHGKTTKSWELEPSPDRENLFGKSVGSQFSDENPSETGFNKGFEKSKTDNDPNPCETFVRAIRSWKTSEDGCLSFAQGDIIEVFTKLDNGWWDGLLRQSRGRFPSNYCEPSISKQGPLEQHLVEVTKPKVELRPLAEDQNAPTYDLSPSLEGSIFDFNIGDPFEAKSTTSDLNMAKQILENSSTQGKGFDQSNPVPPLWIGGSQHLLNPALKNRSFVGSAERKSAFMEFAKYKVVPQTYHFRPGMRGLQVTISTDPASHQSHKDSGDGNKEMSHILEAAENKADDQIKGLDKDPSPRIQRGELTIPPLIHDKNESTPLHRDLSPKPISSSALGVMAKVVSTFLSPDHPLDPGKTRIQWQCRCGYKSFDDFVEIRPGAAREYEQLLQRTQLDRDQSPKGHMSDTVSRFLGRFTKVFSKVLRGLDGGRDFPLPQHKPVDARQQQPQTPAKSADRQIFLLLCIPYRQYATKLLQLDLQDLQSDQNLFKLLRSGYQDIRGRLKSSLSLKTIKSIKFVQFEMYESELVDVRRANDIPPEDRRDEYLYRPMPADLIPPIGENHMLHLYTHPEDANASTRVCLSRIPKKLRERLRACPVQGTSLGWGIHIIEGWHFNLLWLTAFIIVLLASLTFLIFWAILQHDLQGACGVAAYMLAFATLTVGSVQAAVEIGL